MSPSESSRSSSAILSTTSSGSTRQSGLGGNIEWESFNEMRQMDSFRLSGRWLLDRKQQWGEKVESYRAGDFYWGKKRIKTSRSTSSHQQGEVANKQKGFQIILTWGRGQSQPRPSSHPHPLTCDPHDPHLRAQLLSSSHHRLHLSYDPGLTFLPLHLRSSCSHLRLARFLLSITSLPLCHICSSSHVRCDYSLIICKKKKLEISHNKQYKFIIYDNA